jgi:hypothetical protein
MCGVSCSRILCEKGFDVIYYDNLSRAELLKTLSLKLFRKVLLKTLCRKKALPKKQHTLYTLNKDVNRLSTI